MKHYLCDIDNLLIMLVRIITFGNLVTQILDQIVFLLGIQQKWLDIHRISEHDMAAPEENTTKI